MEPTRPTIAIWLATGLGVGLRVRAPGTVGAFWGVPIYAVLAEIPSQAWQLVAVAILIALGVPLATHAAADLVRIGLATEAKDPQSIVCDEYLTVPMVYAFAPAAWTNPWFLLLGFLLHRLFDITKPWPCRALERLPAGWGIMMDDVAAAAYAGVLYALAWHWFGA